MERLNGKFNPCKEIGCKLCCTANTVLLTPGSNEVANFRNRPNVTIFDISPLDNGIRMAAKFEEDCPNHNGECEIHDKPDYPQGCKNFEYAGEKCTARRAEFGLTPAPKPEFANQNI